MSAARRPSLTSSSGAKGASVTLTFKYETRECGSGWNSSGGSWRNTAIDERQRGGTIRSQGSGSSMSPVTQMRRQGMSVGTDREEKLLVTVVHSFGAKDALAAAGRGRKAGRGR